MTQKIKPLGDRVLVRPIEQETTTQSGIVIPDTVKEKPQRGNVLAVGPGIPDEDGNCAPLDLKEDDIVLFNKYAGFKLKRDGEELLILDKEDILALIVE
jgi:chaperonin GroES